MQADQEGHDELGVTTGQVEVESPGMSVETGSGLIPKGLVCLGEGLRCLQVGSRNGWRCSGRDAI